MKKIYLNFIGLDIDLEGDLETETPKEEPKIEFEKQTKDNVSANGKDVVTIPVELLESLMEMAKNGKSSNSTEEKFEKLVKNLTGAIRDNSEIDTRFLGQRPIPFEEVDKEDILDTPAFFFAHSVSRTIWDDYRQGSAIQIPYGRPVKFKTVSRFLTQGNAKNPSFLTVSAAIVHSKKVADFLRNHTEFKITFFEKFTDGKDITAAMAEKLSVAFNMVSQMSEHEVGAACAREGIAIDTMDFGELRRKLATKRARRMLQSESDSRNRSVKDLENFFEGKVEVQSDGSSSASRPLIQSAENRPRTESTY